MEARLCGWKHPRDNGIIFEHEVIPVLRKELDDAREKYATEATEHVLNVNKLCGERDDARNKIADALQEVDLRTLDFDRMKQERDKAMEALMKIEDLFIDGTDIYADRESMGLIAREALGETK